MSRYTPHTKDRSANPHQISVLRQKPDQLSVWVGNTEVASRIPIGLVAEIADALIDWAESHCER